MKIKPSPIRLIGMICMLYVCGIAFDSLFPRSHNPYEASAFIGALIGGITSLAGGIIGSAAANRQRRKMRNLLDQKEQALEGWREAEMNSSYIDRADSRAALRRVEMQNDKTRKAMNTEAARRGMTDEAKVAGAARLNETYADTISQIAAAGQRHKDQVQQQYMSEKNRLDNMRIQNLMDTSGATALAQGITGAGGAAATALIGMEGLKGQAEHAASGTQPKSKASQYVEDNLPAVPGYYQIKLD